MLTARNAVIASEILVRVCCQEESLELTALANDRALFGRNRSGLENPRHCVKYKHWVIAAKKERKSILH
jgi:hypothetical protein